MVFDFYFDGVTVKTGNTRFVVGVVFDGASLGDWSTTNGEAFSSNQNQSWVALTRFTAHDTIIVVLCSDCSSCCSYFVKIGFGSI